MINRIAAVVATAGAMALSLSACGSSTSTNSPTDLANAFLSDLGSNNTTAASKLFPASCRAEFMTGVVMAKAFGIDVQALSDGVKVVSVDNTSATAATVHTSDGNTTKVVKLNDAGNPAPVNGEWYISCDETK